MKPNRLILLAALAVGTIAAVFLIMNFRATDTSVRRPHVNGDSQGVDKHDEAGRRDFQAKLHTHPDHPHDGPGGKASDGDSPHGERSADHPSLDHVEAGKSEAGHRHEVATGDEHAHEREKAKVDEHGHRRETAAGNQPAHEGEPEEDRLVRMRPAEMKQFDIEVAVAGSGTLENRISLPGEVSINEDRQTHVVPRIPGVVKEVRKTLGDTVTKGEILAVIESRELADAKAEYLAALGKVDLTRSRLNREDRLWKKKITSEEEYLTARQEHAEARIALRSAQQKLQALGFSHEYLKRLTKDSDLSFTSYEITAPFDATVIGKHISLGEMLKDDTEAFVVADLSTVWVNLNVYQRDVARIQKGQRVLIGFGEEDERAEGRIAYVEPVVQEETRTALARVVLPNPERNWRPGMFVTAQVLTGNDRAGIVVPESALQTIDEQTVVFVQVPEGFEPRPVKTGRQTENGVEILAGLSAGDRYVSKGSFTLKAQLSKGAFGDGHAH